jgi:hypothetical protein
MDNYFSAAVCMVKNQNLTPSEHVFEEYNTIEKYNTTRLHCQSTMNVTRVNNKYNINKCAQETGSS